MVLKAIETRYKGYRFRSRLEARWAVFFDALGIPWQYEPEGFDLDGLLYLPDFWLPQQDCWLEVKGQSPTDEENEAAARLAVASGKRAYLFVGEPHTAYEGVGESGYVWVPESEPVTNEEDNYSWDNYQAFCICLQCGRIGIRFEGRSERLPCVGCGYCMCVRQGKAKECHRHGLVDHGGCLAMNKTRTSDHPRLLAAYDAARSARFEHGERGR